jgi:hypothetical protein
MATALNMALGDSARHELASRRTVAPYWDLGVPDRVSVRMGCTLIDVAATISAALTRRPSHRFESAKSRLGLLDVSPQRRVGEAGACAGMYREAH